MPTNDWKTLFQTVLSSPDSYLVGEKDVFCFASGTSVYDQIFPPNHIAFGYSAIVEHWLSRKPCDIPNEIWSVRATGKVRDIWREQAKADWRAFLQYRALEMRSSARLLVVGSGADADGNSGAEGLIDLANNVAAQRLPLSFDYFEEIRLPDVYLEQFGQSGDAEAFAEAYTAFFKAAYEPCLFVGLSDSRMPQDREHVIDSFSQKLQAVLAKTPQKYSCSWVLHLMVISKAG